MLWWVNLCLISAGIIAIDVVWHPQKMAVMDSVWVINALWGGPVILIAYYGYGKRRRNHNYYEALSLNTLHCGAGCTLADLIVLVLGLFVTMNRVTSFVLAYVIALVIGVVFQYIAMREMDHDTPTSRLMRKAALSDFWSLTAWQIGMMTGEIVMGMFHPAINVLSQIINMQVAMAIGFILAYPMNGVLVKRHVKRLMM